MTKKIMICMALILSFISCEIDDEDVLTSSITATIEGEEPFVSIPGLTETIGSANTEGVLRDFTIFAIDALGRTFTILVEHIYEGVGVYEIRDYPESMYDAVRVGIGTDDGGWSGGLGEKAGELEVVSVEGNVLKGKFDLIGTNTDDNSTKRIVGDFEIVLNE